MPDHKQVSTLYYRNQNEKVDRIKFVAVHLHLNSESVEAAFMISSMLYEMPNICQEKQSSKFFKKLLESYERNVRPLIKVFRDPGEQPRLRLPSQPGTRKRQLA